MVAKDLGFLVVVVQAQVAMQCESLKNQHSPHREMQIASIVEHRQCHPHREMQLTIT